MTLRDVLIVGGGIGGVSTAASLRAGGFLGRITLIDAAAQPYDRPPLSKDYLAGKKDLGSIALQPADWYDGHDVTLRTRSVVTALRPGSGTLELSTGEQLHADRVVLATGGDAARPPLPGIDLPAVHVLRSSGDADRLRASLKPGAQILVVGAGLIGAEVASTAVDLGAEVTLVDPVAQPLSAIIGAETAGWLHSLHATRGIRTIQAGVEGFEQSPNGVSTTLRGRTETFDAVVLGLGMTPNVSLADTAGIAVDRGIVVDAAQVTSNPAVLAVGDPTRRAIDGVLRGRAEHWEAAKHDGARAAATILGSPPPVDTTPWFWTDRHGLHVEAIGSMSNATTTATRGTVGDRTFAVFGLREDVIVAAVAVNDSHAVRAARRMADRRIRVSAAQLADADTDLRKFLRS